MLDPPPLPPETFWRMLLPAGLRVQLNKAPMQSDEAVTLAGFQVTSLLDLPASRPADDACNPFPVVWMELPSSSCIQGVQGLSEQHAGCPLDVVELVDHQHGCVCGP